MKKIYTVSKYKLWHKRRIVKLSRKKKARKNCHYGIINGIVKQDTQSTRDKSGLILAPEDFRLIENPEGCLAFFKSIRNPNNAVITSNVKIVKISLRNVQKIDYATISVFLSISDSLKINQIVLHGDFPVKEECKAFMIESGFLDHMFTTKKKRFASSQKSNLIFFEKGTGVLSKNDNMRIGDLIKNVVYYLTGESKHFKPVKTILLEICGNSIEHACTEKKQWLLGVKYEKDKVVFTVTDIGKGILETLHKKFKVAFADILMFNDNVEVLRGAFKQKYGSTTQELNRNKGLPAVREYSDNGTILNLIVLTNDVLLHFQNSSISRAFNNNSPKFKGTMYHWEMTKECIVKTYKDNYDN
ncbi:putative membrane protein [Arcticibacter svalbardensis MN12-7]|uniref:Putative membrane protein n=1 Tax=Arcticibacter svalbardensis MN12-7 TaxID=1150600 RepID=R9H5P9_9SPHI|nr:ATP-binding protein [Arcticibacter svalbardensis]EOR96499.1 putative membrane protein [Arcticibacter svalbardensis MN12-7]